MTKTPKPSRPTPHYPGILAWMKQHGGTSSAAECTCTMDCQDDPPTACSLSGEWHVHPGEPCPVHPDAPGDH
jgi:hypothetical protein